MISMKLVSSGPPPTYYTSQAEGPRTPNPIEILKESIDSLRILSYRRLRDFFKDFFEDS